MSPEAKRGPPSSVLSTLNWRFSPASHRPAERVRKSLKGPPGRITEQISLDGVIQAPGGRDEDGAYAHGGWAMPYFDTAIGEAIVGAGQELRSAAWPPHLRNLHRLLAEGRESDSRRSERRDEIRRDPQADSLGGGPVEDLGADIMEGVRGVKSKDATGPTSHPPNPPFGEATAVS